MGALGGVLGVGGLKSNRGASGEGGGNEGQRLLVGVLGSPLGTRGWNSNSGGSSAVVSSLFTRKGSEGTGGRWKDEPVQG